MKNYFRSYQARYKYSIYDDKNNNKKYKYNKTIT